jgi:hypothetical protein
MYSKKGLKLTNEEFQNRLQSFGFSLCEEYINSNTPIKFKCHFCEKIFKRRPKELKSVKCSCHQKHIDYVSRVGEKNLEVLGQYKNIRHKILHRCVKCDMKFITSPKSVINSVYGCPSCSGKKFSIKTYISKLPQDIELISVEYKGSNYDHMHKCKVCEFEWSTKPNYILHMGTSCPKCSSSKGEKAISSILETLDFKYIREYSVNIDGVNYRFDFCVPDLNLIIEFDGVHHYKSIEYFGGEEFFEKVKLNDSIKNKWCEDNLFYLIRIPFDENIELFLIESLSEIFQ